MTTGLLAAPAGVLALVALFVGPPPGKSTPAPRPVAVAEKDHIADFSLVDSSGKTWSREDLLGKVWIASFVLTRCPDGLCPQVTATMKRLQDELPDRPDLRLVTFTVKPEVDPAELDRYARHFGSDPRRWLFLTGSEDEIDRLMRSCYFRAGPRTKGGTDHAQKLVLIDRDGKIRGWYDGLKGPYVAEEDFEHNLLDLRRHTGDLLAPKLPAYLPRDFPAFNATLNGLSGALIFLGWLAIRVRLVRLHIACMLSALFVSAVFLASYLFFHLVIKGGEATRFSEQAPGAPDWVRHLYYTILLSHTILAVVVTPLALYSAYLGLRNRLQKHMRIARVTLPIWLYVSVTGVVVYWMLYRLYAM